MWGYFTWLVCVREREKKQLINSLLIEAWREVIIWTDNDDEEAKEEEEASSGRADYQLKVINKCIASSTTSASSPTLLS